MANTPTPTVPNAAPQADEWWQDPQPVITPAPDAEPKPPEFFLRAETGTVYKTAEEAAKGVAEKDRMIAQQRQELEQARRLLSATGVQLQGASSPQLQQAPLLEALQQAVERGDLSFDQAIAEFTRHQGAQQLQQAMAPLMPLIEYASMNWAVEEAATRFDPNIPAFVRSPVYQKTLEQWPALKGAIQAASSSGVPQYRGMLPELLALAHTSAKASAPAPAVPQRPAPQSSTPPQTVRAGVPQAPLPSNDPFTEQMNAVISQFGDFPL